EAGKRILSAADFGSISNRMGWKPDKSYSDKSDSATNCSASASLRNTGMGLVLFRKMFDLLLMHIPSADRTQQNFPIDFLEHENQEHLSTNPRLTDSPHARFSGMGISHYCWCAQQHIFDLGTRHAMFTAFWPVAGIPI